MKDRLDELFQHCADVGVDVEWKDLGPRRRGEFRKTSNLIVLSRRLDHAQSVSTLAHEFGHWQFGDTCSTPLTERRAWEYGASLVLTSREYAAAERLVGPHTGALALELGVTPPLVEAWRAWWQRRGHLADGERGLGEGQ